MKKENKESLFAEILNQEKSAFVIDEPRFDDNIESLLLAFNAHYPKVKIGYSYKTNYVPSICRAAHQKGCWAEVVSEMEVEMALANLSNRSEIIYNGPVKSRESIQKVIQNGGIINADHLLDIQLIEEIMLQPEFKGQKARVALRLNFSYDNHDSRFGIDRSELNAIKARLQNAETIAFIGYHLHLPFRSVQSFEFRVDALISILKEHNDAPIQYLNIGGGFFGRIEPEMVQALGLSSVPSYEHYGQLIGDKLSEYFHQTGLKEWPVLFIEPGSSVIADALHFLTRIHHIKKVNNKNIAITYAGRHLLSPTNKTVMLPAHIGSFDQAKEKATDIETEYMISGFTCIESDILALVKTKSNLGQNNFISISNVGSYSIVMGSDFILPQPAIYAINDKGKRLIRSSKSVEQIMNSFETL